MAAHGGAVHLVREDADYAMTAAEHLDEVFRLTGLDVGRWLVSIRVRDGHIERLVADPIAKVALDRAELQERRRELSSDDLR